MEKRPAPANQNGLYGNTRRRCRWSPVLILALLGAALAGVGRGQVITEFKIPTANGFPLRMAAGPDGNLWFTERVGNKIGRITTAGVVTEFPVLTAGSNPGGITAGPDGNLWFAESNAGQIGRITTGSTPTPIPRMQIFPIRRPTPAPRVLVDR